jgi:hypothetical protein
MIDFVLQCISPVWHFSPMVHSWRNRTRSIYQKEITMKLVNFYAADGIRAGLQ